MSFLGKVLNSVSSALDFNQATLSGAIDIVVVQDGDTLRSTPFHVRFGKLQVLHSTEKIVTLTVNGNQSDVHMKLGKAGEALFFEDGTFVADDEFATHQSRSLTASPINSPMLHAEAANPSTMDALSLGDARQSSRSSSRSTSPRRSLLSTPPPASRPLTDSRTSSTLSTPTSVPPGLISPSLLVNTTTPHILASAPVARSLDLSNKTLQELNAFDSLVDRPTSHVKLATPLAPPNHGIIAQPESSMGSPSMSAAAPAMTWWTDGWSTQRSTLRSTSSFHNLSAQETEHLKSAAPEYGAKAGTALDSVDPLLRTPVQQSLTGRSLDHTQFSLDGQTASAGVSAESWSVAIPSSDAAADDASMAQSSNKPGFLRSLFSVFSRKSNGVEASAKKGKSGKDSDASALNSPQISKLNSSSASVTSSGSTSLASTPSVPAMPALELPASLALEPLAVSTPIGQTPVVSDQQPARTDFSTPKPVSVGLSSLSSFSMLADLRSSSASKQSNYSAPSVAVSTTPASSHIGSVDRPVTRTLPDTPKPAVPAPSSLHISDTLAAQSVDSLNLASSKSSLQSSVFTSPRVGAAASTQLLSPQSPPVSSLELNRYSSLPVESASKFHSAALASISKRTRKLSADDEFSSQLSSPVASQPTSFFQKSAAETLSGPVELSRVNSFASSTSSQDRVSDEIEVELSLCGSAFESEALMQQSKPGELSAAFNAHKISSTQLSAQPNLIYHPGLVVRFGRQLFPGRVALPLLISYLAFGIPLTDEALQSLSVQSSEAPLQAILAIENSDKFTTASSPEKVTTSDDGGNTDQTSKHGLFSWFRSDRKNKLKVQTADLKVQSPKSSSRPQSAAHDVEETHANDSTAKVEAIMSPSLSASLPPSAFEAPLSPLIAPASTHLAVPVKEPMPASASSPARTERSRRPSHAVLRSFNLQPGLNTISFTVTSTLQGIQTVEAHIFLWRANAKVVISDVDGTITRSDLLGNIMPLMGRDWSHSGVTALFSAIARNGYEILYLTSRAIGQAGITRSYIHSLRQNDIPLPEGPVIMCPDSLIHAFKREVIDRRPHEFKIAALMGVREVFHEDHQPFYAGFGNRDTDIISYRAVGIHPQKIFIINPAGQISQDNKHIRTSYSALTTLVSSAFPPHDAAAGADSDTVYADLGFWRAPIQEFDLNSLLKPTTATEIKAESTSSTNSKNSTMSATESRQVGEGNSMMEMQEDSDMHVPAATEAPELKLANTEKENSEFLPHDAAAGADADNMYADLGFWRPPIQEFDLSLLLKPTAVSEVTPDIDSMISSNYKPWLLLIFMNSRQ